MFTFQALTLNAVKLQNSKIQDFSPYDYKTEFPLNYSWRNMIK